MASNRYLEINDAIDWARQRLSLIREGIVPEEVDEFIVRWRAGKAPVRAQAPRRTCARAART